MKKPYHPTFKTFSGEKPCQEYNEFAAFLKFLASHKIKNYLEVGTGHGDTFHAIMTTLPAGANGIAVDLPQASWGLTDSQKNLEKAIADLASYGHSASAIYGNSWDKEVIAEAVQHAPFDLIFIDGDHTYEGVRRDFENYARYGKLVALHDITNDMKPNKRGEKIEVPKFWQELKDSYQCHEFASSGSNMGIGLVVM